jgi:hypothetical protein
VQFTGDMFLAYGEQRFSELAEHGLAQAVVRVENEDAAYLRGVDSVQYIRSVVDEFAVAETILYVDRAEVRNAEYDVPAAEHPNDFDVERGGFYRRNVVVYHIPWTGDADLLHCRPTPGGLQSPRVWLDGGDLCFGIVDFYGDGRYVRERASQNLDALRRYNDALQQNIHAYNEQLLKEVGTAYRGRLDAFGQRNKVLETLGVPIKVSSSIPATFAVPHVRKKIPRPVAKPESPEPALDGEVYRDILKTVHDTGKAFERMPSTYAGKDEESLRDHFILQLEPRYEGSTTGETFNKTGKTDILMRYERSNLFVAECKVWRGEKAHQDAIGQILSYLTWRDSKAALIHFVMGKEITPVLKAVESSTPSHPNFVSFEGRPSESWFDYRFHLPGDKPRWTSENRPLMDGSKPAISDGGRDRNECLLRDLLLAQVRLSFGSPAAWPALEDVGVVQQPVEQRRDGRSVSE